MDDIIKFPGETRADETVAEFLPKIEPWGCQNIIVVGIDEDGDLRVGSNTSNVERTLALLQLGSVYLSNLIIDAIKVNPPMDSDGTD